MQISISSIKDQQGSALPFDFSISEADFPPLGDDIRLLSAVRVHGKVLNTGESMLVRAQAEGRLELQCSRCLQPVQIDVDAVIEERYRRLGADGLAEHEADALADEEDVGYYERDRIDVGEVVRENFALQIPMKPVCSDGCRGLCPQCGVNFNVETCDCSQDETDPRLAVLREWQARHGSSE